MAWQIKNCFSVPYTVFRLLLSHTTHCFCELYTILRFLLAIEIYIKVLEILTFWLSALISQVAQYLIFILV